MWEKKKNTKPKTYIWTRLHCWKLFINIYWMHSQTYNTKPQIWNTWWTSSRQKFGKTQKVWYTVVTNHVGFVFSEGLLIIQPRKQLEGETSSRKDLILEENSRPFHYSRANAYFWQLEPRSFVKPHISQYQYKHKPMKALDAFTEC